MIPPSVEATISQLESGYGTNETDVHQLVDKLDDPDVVADFKTIHTIAAAVAEVAIDNPELVRERYPDAVDSILRSTESIVLCRTLLHELVERRVHGISPRTISDGIEVAWEFLGEDITEIATTVGSDSDSVPVGGATGIELSERLSSRADSVSGREQLIVEDVARSLHAFVTYYAIRAGLDPIDVTVDLQAQRKQEKPLTYGISASSGGIIEMTEPEHHVYNKSYIDNVLSALTASLIVIGVERSASGILRVEAALADHVDE